MKGFLQQLLKSNFPVSETGKIVHAFGYGSAVFKQANYNVDASDCVIDLILVVDDAQQFHDRNSTQNYGHYSGLSKRLPLSFTANFVQRRGSYMYFNPLIPMKELGLENDQRRLKYGIIQKEDCIQDLTQWTSFALAGRMQKPILNIMEDVEVVKAHEQNLDQALNLSLLLHYHELEAVDMYDVFYTLCNLSYEGDIRMRWKMENPNKVRNILDGNFAGLQNLYQSRIADYEKRGFIKVLEREDGLIRKIRFKHSNDIAQEMFNQVPDAVKYNMKEDVKQLSLQELQGDLRKHLAGIVDLTSIYMILGGIYSTNPLRKGLPYLYSKFKKARTK